ncbi:hypothetical protein AOLI_G00301490, partial [Acnodon oligacanthus]
SAFLQGTRGGSRTEKLRARHQSLKLIFKNRETAFYSMCVGKSARLAVSLSGLTGAVCPIFDHNPP